jgi:hypothetical protein
MMIAIVIGLVFILAGYRTVGKGLVLGTVFSVLNFILIAETLPLRLGKTRGKTFLISLGSIVFRFALMAIPLAAAAKFDQFDIFATICGVFMIQVVILGDHLLKILGSNKSNQIQDHM